jgi:hypothetical protein
MVLVQAFLQIDKSFKQQIYRFLLCHCLALSVKASRLGPIYPPALRLEYSSIRVEGLIKPHESGDARL